MAKKTNPRNIPRTQEDVDRAYARGLKEGCDQSTVIIMSVLLDKFSFEEQSTELWSHIAKLSEEVLEGRVSVADLRTVLREEYNYDP